MKNFYQELVERIRGEVPELEVVVERALLAWSYAQKTSGERDFFFDSVALNLHGFYSGAERIFELVARHLDRSLPTDETWHRDLLWQVTQEFEDVRPALISENSASPDVSQIAVARPWRGVCHRATAGGWTRGVLNSTSQGPKPEDARKDDLNPRSQQVIRGISGLRLLMSLDASGI